MLRIRNRVRKTIEAIQPPDVSENSVETVPTPRRTEHLNYQLLRSDMSVKLLHVPLRLAACLIEYEASERGIENNLPHQAMQDGIKDESLRISVAFEGSCIRGVAVAGMTNEQYELRHWYVVEKLRGMGVGGLLLDSLYIVAPNEAIGAETPSPPTAPDLTHSLA